METNKVPGSLFHQIAFGRLYAGFLTKRDAMKIACFVYSNAKSISGVITINNDATQKVGKIEKCNRFWKLTLDLPKLTVI